MIINILDNRDRYEAALDVIEECGAEIRHLRRLQTTDDDTNTVVADPDPKYVYSTDDEIFNSDKFDSAEEAARDGHCSYGESIYVGEVRAIDVASLVSVNPLMDYVNEQAYDQVGEAAEGWPNYTHSAENELRDMIVSWVKRHDPPKFFRVVNVKHFPLMECDEDDCER